MKRTEITQRIKEGLYTLPYDMEVWLYGSEARGDARPDSDIEWNYALHLAERTSRTEYP